jgi:periplasmic protein TonB
MQRLDRIVPIWLRPAAIVAVMTVHVGVLIAAPWPAADPPAVAAPLAVRVVPMGATASVVDAPEQAQVAELNAVQAQPSDAQAAKAQPVKPPEETEAVETTEAEAKPEPVKKADSAPPDETINETKASALLPEAKIQAVEASVPTLTVATTEQDLPRPKPHATERKPDRREKKVKQSVAHARSQASAVAHRSRAEAVTGANASANYRSIVAAELNRRKFYPPSAKAAGIEGVVVVTFTVGAGGRVANHTITRSSGVSELDRAVHQMMAAVSVPPPPGGRFRATVPIRFDLQR